jgi:RNA polymerase sigma-70 factor (ECF subfamily)
MTEVERGDTIDETTLVDLLRRAQDFGDPEAFDGLYNLFADRVYRFLIARLENADAAEEITAQVFLRLLEKITKYRIAPKDNVAIFSAWLYRMTYNKMIDNIRANQRAKLVPIESAYNVEHRYQLTADVEKRMRIEHILNKLRLLNEQQSQVILLRFIEGYSIAETARIMQKSEGAVKALQHRSLESLRRYLREREPDEV